MTRPQQTMRIGATPKKLALIAILAVVWVAVIVRNFGGAASESSDELGPRRVGGVRTELVLQPASKREDWTQPELEATQRVDPLAGINSAAAPESEVVGAEPTRATSEVMEALRRGDQAMVFVAEDAKVIRVGEYELRVGDEVDGYAIRDITSRGVVFEPKAQQ